MAHRAAQKQQLTRENDAAKRGPSSQSRPPIPEVVEQTSPLGPVDLLALRTGEMPGSLSPAAATQLQRSIGNRAIGRLASESSLRWSDDGSSRVSSSTLQTLVSRSADIAQRAMTEVGANDQLRERPGQLAGQRGDSAPDLPHITPANGASIQRAFDKSNIRVPTTNKKHPALEHLGLTGLSPYKFYPATGKFEYQKPDKSKGFQRYIDLLNAHKSDTIDYAPEQIGDVVGGWVWKSPEGEDITLHPNGVKKAKKDDRIKTAKQAFDQEVTEDKYGYKKSIPDLVAKLKLHDNGRTPRPFVSLANEDVLGADRNAHNLARHVVGGADMPNAQAVAIRAAFGKIGGLGAEKDAQYNATASAFQDEAAGNAEVAAAIDGQLKPNWKALRYSLLENAKIELDYARTGKAIVAYNKASGDQSTPYPDSEKPAYLYSGATGERPLFQGDPAWETWAGSQTGLSRPKGELEADPLVEDVSGALPNVHVRIVASDNDAAKGWIINSAYPNR